jgi:hypothetical protein
VDSLHTLHLGVFKAFCLEVFWACIDADVWKTNATSVDVRFAVSCDRLRQDLFAWYRRKERSDPQQDLYKLSDLTPAMLGNPRHRSLATKAAETGTLIEFARDVVAEHRVRLGTSGSALLTVGNALVQLRNTMRESPQRMSADQAQQLVDCAKTAFVYRAAAGIPFTPTWHLMLHLASDAWSSGNPGCLATFLDESLNGFLAKMAASSHRLTWHRSVLAAFNWSARHKGSTR